MSKHALTFILGAACVLVTTSIAPADAAENCISAAGEVACVETGVLAQGPPGPAGPPGPPGPGAAFRFEELDPFPRTNFGGGDECTILNAVETPTNATGTLFADAMVKVSQAGTTTTRLKLTLSPTDCASGTLVQDGEAHLRKAIAAPSGATATVYLLGWTDGTTNAATAGTRSLYVTFYAD